MADKLNELQIRFHLDKISLLTKELETKKIAGEKRIWKSQLELAGELNRLRLQIQMHETKIKELQAT